MNKSVALIGSGILSKELAERAKSLNIVTHCFSNNDKDIACEAVDFFHKIDIFDIQSIVRICKINNVSGIIATTELTIFPASQIANELGLLSNNINVADEITNKYLTRNKLQHCIHIKQPKYWYINDESFPIITFPSIVKPVAAGGKRGINVVYNNEQLVSAVEEASGYSRKKGVLVEEFLPNGKEYSIEVLSYKGKHYLVQITEKDTSGPPHCNELGHHQPANLKLGQRNKIKKAINEMLNTLKIMNGPSHTEIKIIDNKIYLIEMNDRPGGDHITYPLTELSTGYPYLSGILWASLGLLDGHEPIKLKKYYSGIYFITDKTIKYKEIFDVCEKYDWLYKKNKINDAVSKIIFNDENGLNYFIYFSKKSNPRKFIEKYTNEYEKRNRK